MREAVGTTLVVFGALVIYAEHHEPGNDEGFIERKWREMRERLDERKQDA